ncbi:glycosyltransferase family 2 protein [Dyella jejuensis]|uniref:Glycosyltransferase family 2 protein n=2 Tax=Dyella jejuensis TaxID=1432009 RepID=A0ABW8JMD8_9GAMM
MLSVVVPVYNEKDVLPKFHDRLLCVLESLCDPFEVIYINDGSSDQSLEILKSFCAANRFVSCIDLSRNFGKESAMTAGLDYSRGNAVIIIDADLQDPPEIIPELLSRWREGYDNVYATRRRRHGETWLKRVTAGMFYKVIGGLSRVKIPADTGDFRLLSRRAVDALLQLREQHRFMKGLFAWIGYDAVALEYDRDPRFAGESKFNYVKLWNFALEGITSFSIAPLKISSYFGAFVAIMAGIYAVSVVIKTMIFGNPVAGYASLMCSVLFLGGVQLVAIGILGEYIGRMFNQTKNRPLYFVKRYFHAESGEQKP